MWNNMLLKIEFLRNYTTHTGKFTHLAICLEKKKILSNVPDLFFDDPILLVSSIVLLLIL